MTTSEPPTLAGAAGDAVGGAATERVRLAILDDHEVLLDSLGSWISSHAPDFEVVLMAATWLQLVHSPAFPTDLVFIDFQLKEPVSIEARVRTCRAAGARVIVLSSIDTPRGTGSRARRRCRRLRLEGAADGIRDGCRPPHHGHGGRLGCAPRLAAAPARRDDAAGQAALSPGEEEALRLYAAGSAPPRSPSR